MASTVRTSEGKLVDEDGNALSLTALAPNSRTTYTLTYTTAAATIPNATAVAAAATAATTTTPAGYTTTGQADAIRAGVNALIADVDALRQVVVRIVKDLQAHGMGK